MRSKEKPLGSDGGTKDDDDDDDDDDEADGEVCSIILLNTACSFMLPLLPPATATWSTERVKEKDRQEVGRDGVEVGVG